MSAAALSLELVRVEHERELLMGRMERFYEGLVGSKCKAQIFVVSRVSVRGCYYVHRLDSCDFYEVNIRERGSQGGSRE